MGRGHVQNRPPACERQGTITLFAALSYLEGKVLSRSEQRLTHVEWVRFLKQIDRPTPTELTIHLIADNYSTHKREAVKPWLARHPRFILHFFPRGTSWLNLVERCIRDPGHAGFKPIA